MEPPFRKKESNLLNIRISTTSIFHIFVCAILVYVRLQKRFDVVVIKIKGDVKIMPLITYQWNPTSR